MSRGQTDAKQRSPARARAGSGLYGRVRRILESARTSAARSVNTAQVVANWMVGREIVEEEQQGQERAGYAERLVALLSERLGRDYGAGYSVQNLWYMRQFYLAYPELTGASEILHAVRGELAQYPQKGLKPEARAIVAATARETEADDEIRHAVRGELTPAGRPAAGQKPRPTRDSGILHAVRGELAGWIPGRLHPGLSWTHYRTLLRVESQMARAFYEIEAVSQAWPARELERQIDSLLFERLARSRDKKGVMKLASEGHSVSLPMDVFKDPVVIEFLGLPESPRLVESTLEKALIDNLQRFLLELGKGFAFVSRQERITLDGDHFYVDLVFYHTILKCFVLIDLKVGKLAHSDLGQMQFYVNYFDRERRSEGDNPTLGLILASNKNDAVVRYTLGEQQARKIFTSRYQFHLPTAKELESEIRREVRMISGPQTGAVTARQKKKARVVRRAGK